MSASPDPRSDDRAAPGLWLLLWVFVVTLVAGALVAPPIYWWIHGWAAGGSSDLAAYLARKAFPRYFDRIRWLMVLAALPWICRAAGFTTARSLGLRGGPEGRRRLAVWLGVGSSMVAAMAAGQLASGVALVRPGLSTGDVVLTVAIALAGAALIGFLEEVVFRGVVFQLARRSLPAWGAVPVAAAIFALLHFLRVPGDAWPAGTPVTWASGFRVSWETLASVPQTLDPATGVALFLAGSILCLLFLRHESLLPPIGLHAGWVLAARLHDRLLRVPDGVDTRFWGGRHLIDGALPLALLFLLMVGMILALRYSAASLSRRSA